MARRGVLAVRYGGTSCRRAALPVGGGPDARTMSKVPAVTLGFWIIKILATTLGETGGDTVTMTLNWGYLAGTALFAALLIALGRVDG